MSVEGPPVAFGAGRASGTVSDARRQRRGGPARVIVMTRCPWP